MIEDPDSPVTTRLRLQEHLKAVELFIDSIGHKGYVEGMELEIQQVKDAIILNEPIDKASEIEGYKMRGDLRTLEQKKTLFEDVRLTLKQRIEEMLERENKTDDKEKRYNDEG
jgi:hypothetical protein